MARANEAEPGVLDYVKEAFFARAPVKGLGNVPANVLFVAAIGILGVAMPGLWLIGGGLELGWLAWLSQNPRFQTIVRGKRLQERAESFGERLRATVTRLPLPERSRWEELRQKCDSLRQMSIALQPKAAGTMDAVQESGLNSLLLIHANLLQSKVTLEHHLSARSGEEIQKKLDDAEHKLATADGDAIKRSLEANVAILKKRILHHQNAAKNVEVIDSEIERIENQVDLIREEASVARDPEALSARIDSVAATIGDVNQVLAASAELLGDLDAPGTLMPPPPARTSVKE